MTNSTLPYCLAQVHNLYSPAPLKEPMLAAKENFRGMTYVFFFQPLLMATNVLNHKSTKLSIGCQHRQNQFSQIKNLRIKMPV